MSKSEGRGSCSHRDTHIHTQQVYTTSRCNKVILRPAQVNKVQERECGRNRIKMAQHLQANYQSEEARGETQRGEGGQINAQEDRRNGKDGARRGDGV